MNGWMNGQTENIIAFCQSKLQMHKKLTSVHEKYDTYIQY